MTRTGHFMKKSFCGGSDVSIAVLRGTTECAVDLLQECCPVVVRCAIRVIACVHPPVVGTFMLGSTPKEERKKEQFSKKHTFTFIALWLLQHTYTYEFYCRVQYSWIIYVDLFFLTLFECSSKTMIFTSARPTRIFFEKIDNRFIALMRTMSFISDHALLFTFSLGVKEQLFKCE